MGTGTHQTFERPSPPVELELGDGSRLVLENADASAIVRRLEGSERISLADAMRMSGQPFAGYRRLEN